MNFLQQQHPLNDIHYTGSFEVMNKSSQPLNINADIDFNEKLIRADKSLILTKLATPSRMERWFALYNQVIDDVNNKRLFAPSSSEDNGQKLLFTSRFEYLRETSYNSLQWFLVNTAAGLYHFSVSSFDQSLYYLDQSLSLFTEYSSLDIAQLDNNKQAPIHFLSRMVQTLLLEYPLLKQVCIFVERHKPSRHYRFIPTGFPLFCEWATYLRFLKAMCVINLGGYANIHNILLLNLVPFAATTTTTTSQLLQQWQTISANHPLAHHICTNHQYHVQVSMYMFFGYVLRNRISSFFPKSCSLAFWKSIIPNPLYANLIHQKVVAISNVHRQFRKNKVATHMLVYNEFYTIFLLRTCRLLSVKSQKDRDRQSKRLLALNLVVHTVFMPFVKKKTTTLEQVFIQSTYFLNRNTLIN